MAKWWNDSIISKSNFGFGEGKCLGGGTYINGGLIWRTPEIVLDKWNKMLNTNLFSLNSLNNDFDEIEKILGFSDLEDKLIENNESKKLLEIGKLKKIMVSKVPRSINSSKR